ncbi:MAG: aspartyl protease family protein [Sphingomonadaceae bacterium]
MGRALLAAAALLSASAAIPEKPKPAPLPAMPPLKPAVIDDSLAITGEELAARKLKTRLTVEVGVNGTGPYRFVVDSGADTSVIGDRLARALKLPLGEPAMLHGITESRRVERVQVESLQLGSTVVRDLELPRLEDYHVGAAGMIGLDALVEQRMVLDFDKRRVTIDDGSRPAPRMDDEIVVTARLKRGQLILTQVRAGALPLSAVVDTGSEITIGNMALHRKIARNKKVVMSQVELIGVTGAAVKVDIAVVPELRLGAVILTNVPIAFADVPPFAVFGLQDQPALLLGTDLMETFRRVSLDFHNRKVRFQLRKCTSEGVVIQTSQTLTRLSTEKDNKSACKG